MKRAIVLFLLVFMLFSCESLKPKKAKFEIINTVKTMTDFGRPSILITVKNTGNATGYNVGVDVHAKNAQGTIIDTGHAFPADLGNIPPEGTAQDDAVFFELNSHSDYASLSYDIDWLTRE